MKFLVDECVDARLADVLRDWGHDATAIARDYTRSIEGTDVLGIGEREGRILITNDTDFGELVVRHRRPHAGVILLRLGSYQFAEPAEHRHRRAADQQPHEPAAVAEIRRDNQHLMVGAPEHRALV